MRARFFTLIELLVVVAVISALAALLLPALSSAKRVAQKSFCSGSMRQIYFGFMSYSSDYDSWLPNNNVNRWQQSIYPLMNVKGNASGGDIVKIDWWKPNSRCVAICPAALSPGQGPQWDPSSVYSGEPWGGTYVMTSTWVASPNVPPPYGGSSNYGWLPKRLDHVISGSAFLIEGAYFSVANGAACMKYNGWSNSGAPGSTAASLSYVNQQYGAAWPHNLSANFNFVDGSVRLLKAGVQWNSNWQLK